MFLKIQSLLDRDELVSVRDQLSTLRWVDGTQTAGSSAKQVKVNSQADLTTRSGAKLRDALNVTIRTHPVLKAAAQPARFSKILVSRTIMDGGYGLHFDNPFMGAGEDRLRTDLSYTLFLSEPDSYDGGALSIEQAGERKTFKPEAGTLVLYPSTSLHQVEPVTSGERLVCVGWIESRVRSAERREILFDLENLHAELSKSQSAQSATLLTLGKVLANLKRDFS